MKYLFSVDDISSDSTKLYTVKAESENEAKAYFAKIFFPHFELDFDTLANGLANGLDLVIAYLGPTSLIQEL